MKENNQRSTYALGKRAFDNTINESHEPLGLI